MAVLIQDILKQPRAQQVASGLTAGSTIEAINNSGTVLVVFTLANPATSAVSTSGTFSGLSMPRSATAVATGTAVNYRVKNGAGGILWQGENGDVTITGGGGAITLNSTAISSGQAVNLTSLSWAE